MRRVANRLPIEIAIWHPLASAIRDEPMTLFAIIQQPDVNSGKLEPAVRSIYPDALYSLGSGVWLVADSVTAEDVSDKLGVSTGENGAAVILEVGSYFGWANPAIWSWMKTKWKAAPSG
jgi:hypothetical protein